MTARDVPPMSPVDISPAGFPPEGLPAETDAYGDPEMPAADPSQAGRLTVPEEADALSMPGALGMSGAPGMSGALDEAGVQEGPEALIAAFFQSMFGLAFDGRPNVFSPAWDYRPDVAREGQHEEAPHEKAPYEDDLPQAHGGSHEGSADVAGGASTAPRFPSGPIPHGQPGLLARRLAASPLARLYYAAAMAEVAVLPHFAARRAADKDDQNQGIARAVGLDRAVRAGLITGYTILWPAGRYPKTARSIRLRVPGGSRQRGRALGEMEAPLRALIDAMKGTPDVQ